MREDETGRGATALPHRRFERVSCTNMVRRPVVRGWTVSYASTYILTY